MSFISNDYINSIERGYGDSDKKLCHECIGNKSLKEYIKANGYVCTCDYCGQRRKAVNLDSFMVIIMSGVNFLYTHAVNELPCDSGEYIGKTYTTAQLIFEELRDEIDAQDERILKDIVTVDNNSTLIAKGKIHIDSLANEKVSELVKKQKIPKETIESIVKRTEQK